MINFMELLGQFILFFAKVATVVIGFLVLFAGVTIISRKKNLNREPGN